MGSEQQFCLKWNNHQSTIVAGFDTLLESGTLVDCTLAAEGQYLKAHKVVLSACSPYFELLLSQHDEKHPIVILKDVKFQELKAMVDYMYHGEVNISQDQLGALLKAAESLQIKGLSDSGGGGSERENVDKRHHGTRKQTIPPSQPRSSPIPPHSSTLGHRRPPPPPPPQPPAAPPPIVDLPDDDSPSPSRPPLPRVPSSREGSSSPPPKRKRHRRRSSGEDGSLSAAPVVPLIEGTHETNSSSELPSQSQPAPSASVPSIPANITPVVPPSSEQTVVPSSQASDQPVTETELLNRTQTEVASPRQQPHEISHEPVLEPVQKVEPPSEVKSEYLDEDVNEDSVEDLTLDDDMDEMDHARPGPSHGGEGSSSQGAGFAPWHVADQSRDEVFMAAQEAVGAHRDSQGAVPIIGQEDFFNEDNSFLEHITPDWYISEHVTCMSYSTKVMGRSSSDLNQQKYGSPSELFINNQHNMPYNPRLSSHNVKATDHFPCPKCNKVYTWKANLNRHLRLECGKKPHLQCPYCAYVTNRKTSVQEHIRRRHKEMPNII